MESIFSSTGLSPGLALLLVFAAVVLGVILWRAFLGGSRRGLYTAAKLLTSAECEFYRKMQAACPAGLVVMVKVRLADLVSIPRGLERKERFRVLAPLAQKHVDFVVFNPAQNQVVRVIELNDSTHRQMDRRARDIYVRNVLESAGVGLTEMPLRRSYSDGELAALFR
jgi:hypothetical protein